MEKRKFRWRYLVVSLPFAFFFMFVDQGGTFYPSEIRVAVILILGILMGLKKKEELFALGNAFSTMFFVFGLINIYALPGTVTTNLMVTSPLTILPSFSLALLVYAILSIIKVFYRLKKDDNQSMDEEKKHKFSYILIPVSYFACIGTYGLIITFIRTVYPFNDGQGSAESKVWGNWHYQNDVLVFTGLVFIALAFMSMPILKAILSRKDQVSGHKTRKS